MKRVILLIFTLAVLTFSAAGQSRTNRIYRLCPGTVTLASVAIDRSGDITITPCSGKTTTISGYAGGSGSTTKVYRALVTQSGTSAPVATVLENSFTGTLVWTRTDVGAYQITLTGAFAGFATKGFLRPVLFRDENETAGFCQWNGNSNNVLDVQCFAIATMAALDIAGGSLVFEIIKYP